MTETALPSSEYLPGYYEAIAIWTICYLALSGFVCMLSIQAETDADVLIKQRTHFIVLLRLNFRIPFPTNSFDDLKNPNGKGSGATAMVKLDNNVKNPTCSMHGIAIQRWINDRHA